MTKDEWQKAYAKCWRIACQDMTSYRAYGLAKSAFGFLDTDSDTWADPIDAASTDICMYELLLVKLGVL